MSAVGEPVVEIPLYFKLAEALSLAILTNGFQANSASVPSALSGHGDRFLHEIR
jgi:hypothetical protein